jgi:hypothetical protein
MPTEPEPGSPEGRRLRSCAAWYYRRSCRSCHTARPCRGAGVQHCESGMTSDLNKIIRTNYCSRLSSARALLPHAGGPRSCCPRGNCTARHAFSGAIYMKPSHFRAGRRRRQPAAMDGSQFLPLPPPQAAGDLTTPQQPPALINPVLAITPQLAWAYITWLCKDDSITAGPYNTCCSAG